MNDDPELHNPLDDGPYPVLKAFLLSRGIPRHKQTAEVAGLLGLAKTSVFRKFKGESSFSQPELKVISDHFGVAVDTLLGVSGTRSERKGAGGAPESARVCLPGLPTHGQLLVGPALAEDDVCDLVAIRKADGWEVHPGHSSETHGQVRHSIASLCISSAPRQRVALLEDDSNAAAVVAMALEGEGMVVLSTGPDGLEEKLTRLEKVKLGPAEGLLVKLAE